VTLPPTLALLHTAAAQVEPFEDLLRALEPGIRVRHAVEPALLDEARAAGCIGPALRARVRDVAAALLHGGARVVVCTCSTLGGCAEDAGSALGAPILRIDRPMAEQAVAAGSPLLVVAALESTLAPTCALLHDTAQRRGLSPQIRALVCEGAWALFEAGDRPAYHAAIAAAIRKGRGDACAIVLAQASMADAETLCGDVPVPVLSSSRSGLRAALDLLSSLSR
jgi:hypothetical protein